MIGPWRLPVSTFISLSVCKISGTLIHGNVFQINKQERFFNQKTSNRGLVGITSSPSRYTAYPLKRVCQPLELDTLLQCLSQVLWASMWWNRDQNLGPVVLTTNIHCLKGTCSDGDGRELQEMTQVVVSQSHLLASRRKNFDVCCTEGVVVVVVMIRRCPRSIIVNFPKGLF